jgi:exopolyphosphatase/guanosine-5'-triphosphate,3'-diphosphate pyrophosphatase
VSWSSSFLVGSGVLAQHYLVSDPPSLLELRAARDHAMDVLATRAFPAADCAVAVGGSAASLRTVVGEQLDPRSLHRALGMLCGGPATAVAASFSLDAERVRLLPAGILILDACAQRLRQPLQIGRGGLREGILLDMARTL